MTTIKISKEKHSKKEIEQKLKTNEYVFEINERDILDVYVKYSLDYIESIIFKNGKKTDIIKEPSITIELKGNDKDNNEASIGFNLKTDIDYLNTLSNIPTDISKLLIESEIFIKRPLEGLVDFLDFELAKNTEEDIYKNLSSLWVSKINENEFIMKLCVPNEVFTYFKIVFGK